MWDILQQSGGRFEFNTVRFANCLDCGQSLPARMMHQKYDSQPRKRDEQRLVCERCFEAARAAWRMDGEKSFARLEITPVRTARASYYHLSYSIKIEPYPNPFSYGGMFGNGSAATKEELDRAIASFSKQAETLRSNGMKEIEVVTGEETVRVEQPRLEAPGRNETKQAQVDAAAPEVRQLALI